VRRRPLTSTTQPEFPLFSVAPAPGAAETALPLALPPSRPPRSPAARLFFALPELLRRRAS